VSAPNPAAVPLCALDDIADGGAKSFWFGEGATRRGIFLLRRGETVVAYVNACPHVGTPLNFLGDRFLDRNGELILCATHGALFRVADGFCVRGPCLGAKLTPVRTIITDHMVFLSGDFPI
jgi:nitrite reductase/ring-hydroxylating ferredoxin subunit